MTQLRSAVFDGSKQLRVLRDSQGWNLPFSFCKFTPPVVANGKLYISDQDVLLCYDVKEKK